MHRFRNESAGFTLIELMIVVLVISILSMVAMPAYTEYVIRGKIAEATSALADGRVKLEQFFQDNKTYIGGSCPATTESFTYDCTDLTTATYTITAIGKAGSNVSAFSYTIDQSNVRSSTTPWGNNATCWIKKKGGAC